MHKPVDGNNDDVEPEAPLTLEQRLAVLEARVTTLEGMVPKPGELNRVVRRALDDAIRETQS